MVKKKTIEDCYTLAIKKDGFFLSEKYITSGVKYLWKCKRGHEFWMTYGHVQQGKWCVECAGLKRKTIEDCYKLANQNNGKFFSDKYVNTRTKYIWECAKGHRWKTTYENVQQGYWCPECANARRGSTQRLTLQECCEIATKKGGRFLSEEYFNSKTKYVWECKKKHIFLMTLECVKHRNCWCPKCGKKKQIQTCIKKYGVPVPCQDKKIALKAAKSSNNSYILYHWKTNEEVVCVGSWEKDVVLWLNKNKINFKWQPEIFETPFLTPIRKYNSTYRPDFYLIDQNLWIEIKGYFRKDAKEKWDWFHKKYPNSELWSKAKLKELKILY